MHSKERSGVVDRAVDKTRLRRAEEIRERVELGLCASANGRRKKKQLTGGTALAEAHTRAWEQRFANALGRSDWDPTIHNRRALGWSE